MAKVAVIGAGKDYFAFLCCCPAKVIFIGPQGLCALKNLREEGFEVTLFEKCAYIGGAWQFTESRDQTCVLPSKRVGT